jgi:hypothetical protein
MKIGTPSWWSPSHQPAASTVPRPATTAPDAISSPITSSSALAGFAAPGASSPLNPSHQWSRRRARLLRTLYPDDERPPPRSTPGGGDSAKSCGTTPLRVIARAARLPASRPLVQLLERQLMHRIRGKLTYANVMATIAVFIALGGASYAAVKLPKNSVGTKQLKSGAVTGAKIKQGSVTAANIAPGVLAQPAIDPSKLGTVPTAVDAANAAHATSADSAARAESANSLQGMTAAQIVAGSKLHCPSDTTPAGGLCVESAIRGAENFFDAQVTCAEAGRLMPPESVLLAFLGPAIQNKETTTEEWAVAGGGLEEGYARTLRVRGNIGGFVYAIGDVNEGGVLPFRCAALPTN